MPSRSVGVAEDLGFQTQKPLDLVWNGLGAGETLPHSQSPGTLTCGPVSEADRKSVV